MSSVFRPTKTREQRQRKMGETKGRGTRHGGDRGGAGRRRGWGGGGGVASHTALTLVGSLEGCVTLSVKANETGHTGMLQLSHFPVAAADNIKSNTFLQVTAMVSQNIRTSSAESRTAPVAVELVLQARSRTPSNYVRCFWSMRTTKYSSLKSSSRTASNSVQAPLAGPSAAVAITFSPFICTAVRGFTSSFLGWYAMWPCSRRTHAKNTELYHTSYGCLDKTSFKYMVTNVRTPPIRLLTADIRKLYSDYMKHNAQATPTTARPPPRAPHPHTPKPAPHPNPFYPHLSLLLPRFARLEEGLRLLLLFVNKRGTRGYVSSSLAGGGHT